MDNATGVGNVSNFVEQSALKECQKQPLNDKPGYIRLPSGFKSVQLCGPKKQSQPASVSIDNGRPFPTSQANNVTSRGHIMRGVRPSLHTATSNQNFMKMREPRKDATNREKVSLYCFAEESILLLF